MQLESFETWFTLWFKPEEMKYLYWRCWRAAYLSGYNAGYAAGYAAKESQEYESIQAALELTAEVAGLK